jgi:hypothetical protein
METDSDPDPFLRETSSNRIVDEESKLEAIREAVMAGEESGIADGDVMKEVRERMHRRASAKGRRG